MVILYSDTDNFMKDWNENVVFKRVNLFNFP